MRRWGIVVVVVALAAACSGDDGEDAPEARPLPIEDVRELDASLEPEGCDVLDQRACLLPFPSDAYTVDDSETDTGRRVALPAEGMPVDAEGVAVDPEPWRGNDGFSPGSAIHTFVPDLDLEASGAPILTGIGRSLEDDSPIVLLDTDTGERHPFFAELDSNAEEDGNRLLILRPAVNLPEGHHFVVAMRDLVDTSGDPIEADLVFRTFRDNLTTELEPIEDRRPAMERVFEELADAGIERESLSLAWDFTVASERNLSERLLHIRDDAFAELGEDAPAFTVTAVEDDPEPELARRVEGTFEVPSYLTEDGSAGTQFTQGPDGLPERNGALEAQFMCIVPNSAVEAGAGTARPVVYGHGLLGSRDEVDAGNVRAMADEHGMVFCATDWIGMAEEDVGNAVSILQDIDRFPTLADRVQQGILNTLFLARLMLHEDGLGTDAALQDGQGASLLDTRELFFDGNSQGAIIGGAATAVAQDWTRAVLGVGAMNYSTLLHRSVDFDTYAAILEPAYPDEMERTLGISLIQMLWDRAETNGYAQHITSDPYPDTPEHQVLMHVAVGDHQVSTTAAEVMARTMGARLYEPALAEDRLPEGDAFWDLSGIEEFPYDGSAIVFWDSGAPLPPLENVPPREGEDPHEDPRADADARRQKDAFLSTDGGVIDVCDAAPCEAEPVPD